MNTEQLSAASQTVIELARYLEDLKAEALSIFDPAKVQDHATYEKPHQYATGMTHVFVNGTLVLKDGDHTGAKPGRAVWGPGKTDR